MQSGSNRTRRAFTLVEMLVVIAILTVMMAATVPVITALFRTRVMDQADSVIQSAALRARAMAIETRSNCDLIIDDVANQLYIRSQGTSKSEVFYSGVVDHYAPYDNTNPNTTPAVYFNGALGLPNLKSIDFSDPAKRYYVFITRSSSVQGQLREINSTLPVPIDLTVTPPRITLTHTTSTDWASPNAPAPGDQFTITVQDWLYGGMVDQTDGSNPLKIFLNTKAAGLPNLNPSDPNLTSYSMLITKCTHTHNIQGQMRPITGIDESNPANVFITVASNWDHGKAEFGDLFIITRRNVTADEMLTMPQNTHLLRGTFPEAVTFTPSGSLNSGTILSGFYYIGPTVFNGQVLHAQNLHDVAHHRYDTGTLITVGTPWLKHDLYLRDQIVSYAGDYLVITKSDTAGVVVRTITANTGNILMLDNPWPLDTSAPPVGGLTLIKPGDRFAIVTPENIRQVMIYSTTGLVQTRYPTIGRLGR